ncbi:MAG: hypothetical protein IT438_14185 [Phycisphaerales bacterium]|nr:hypothetical protein [Phycisphaerales bacterium]
MNRPRAKGQKPGMVIALCGGVAIACWLGGCAASSVPRREAGSASRFGGDQGASAEVVFAPVEVGDWGAPEYGRRDAQLSVREDGPLLATSQWPEPERASLENPRYLYIRDRDGRYTYFVPDRAYSPRYWTGWGWR